MPPLSPIVPFASGMGLGIAILASTGTLWAGSFDGAVLRAAGAIWHDGQLEVNLPVPDGIDPTPLADPPLPRVESGLNLSSVRWIGMPQDATGPADRRLVLQVNSPSLYNDMGRPWFVGIPGFNPGAGAKPGPVLGVFRVPAPVGWSAVGSGELGLPNSVFAEPAAHSHTLRSFQITSGGSESAGAYDELVMIHEYVHGDFDRVLQVVSVTPTASFGAAGLMARESLDVGRRRSQGGFSRFASIEAPGPRLGGASFVFAGRAETGATLPFYYPGGTVNFPAAWVRLIRRGNTLEGLYRTSRPQSPGDEWVSLGTVTLPGLAPDLFVGPHYSPQLKYEGVGEGQAYPPARASLANYGNFNDLFLVVDGGDPLSIHQVGDSQFLHWGGFLFGRAHVEQSMDLITWETDPTLREAPIFVPAGEPVRFWRLAQ